MLGRKILIIQTAFIGDAILATALVNKIHTHEPDAAIDFLCRKGNESLLLTHPHIKKVWIWDKKKDKITNLWRLIWAVRQHGYDEVINLQRYLSTGLITVFSDARIKNGFSQNPLSRLFTQHKKHDMTQGMHEVQRNALLYRQDDTNLYKPSLYPTKADYDAIAQWIKTPFITIAPASVWPTKRLPKEIWIAFVNALPHHINVYLLGGKEDEALCNDIAQACSAKAPNNLAGKITLLQSAALMQRAAMNYVNDSAPLHLCSAMNAPTCAIFCSTVPSFGFGPLADQSYVVEVSAPLSCRPCGNHGKNACPLAHFKCGNSISLSQLMQPINNLL